MSHTNTAKHAPSVVEAVQSGASDIAAAGSNIYRAAIDQSSAAGRQVDQYVHKNAWRAVGIAAGAGLLIGLLLRRR